MSAELMKSKFVRRLSSVVRPSVASIISEVTAWISFKFYLWLALGHMPRRMGAKTSKRYSSLKSLLNPFKLFLKFLLSGPDKTNVLDF